MNDHKIINTVCYNPLISIISPTYNSKKFIRETVKSIQGQTYKNWELLITDDCSTDDTWQILGELAEKDSRIKLEKSDVNQGAASSRNASLSRARGDYLAFIDADDIWDNRKLEKQIKFMHEAEIAFSFTSYEIMDENGNRTDKIIDHSVPNSLGYKDMLMKRATLGCSTVMINKNVVGEIRMPLIRTGQDYATWLNVLKSGHRAFCLPVPLTKYRIVSDSISRNKVKKAMRQWQIYREIEKIGLFKSAFYFCNYAYRATMR
ncbi:glycosyltransferase family 2 protein [Ferrimonas pelagia]|uniref:Glycosyltransferase family 2 protein n=1 Tax=Ferrimonas pelagia TaxID=1177826 RepID=A0ABP9EEB7_9GAMM